MKILQQIISILLISLIAACGAGQSGTPIGTNDVEAVMSQYYDNVGSYNFAGMRAVYTPDFEILDDGHRFDADDFEELVRRLESLGMTWDFSLSDFNTEIKQDIGYTSYVISDVSGRRWFGSAVLERTDGDLWIDRMSMITEAEPQDGPPESADGEQPEYNISQITGDLYRFQNGGHYNVFLVTPEGIIMTDPSSDFTDDAALWLKDQLAQRFGVPVKYVLYSHHHLDHVSGGEVFADTATFIGHENMLEKFEPPADDEPLPAFFAGMDRDDDGRLSLEEAGPLDSRFEAWDANEDGYLDGAEIAVKVVDRVRPPDEVFSDRKEIELGGKTVQMVYTGPNHADDMSVIYFPEERVIYGADLVSAFNGLPGGAFSGMPMSDWIDSYKTVEALDFDILAPGHGPMARKADVTLSRMAWEDLYAVVTAGIEAGQSLEEIQQTSELDHYMHYPAYDERLGRSIAEAYKAITAHE